MGTAGSVWMLNTTSISRLESLARARGTATRRVRTSGESMFPWPWRRVTLHPCAHHSPLTTLVYIQDARDAVSRCWLSTLIILAFGARSCPKPLYDTELAQDRPTTNTSASAQRTDYIGTSLSPVQAH